VQFNRSFPFSLAMVVLTFAGAENCRAADPVLPAMPDILQSLPALFYAESPRQIPATVIASDPIANVPYSSFQLGPDRELNIYGDPAHPVCIEIALYGSLADSAVEMRRSLELLHRLVPQVDWGVAQLGGGKILRNGLVAEVTPATAPGARGGWHVSLYNLAQLNAAHATTVNVSAVTVEKDSASGLSGWTPDDMKRARASSPEHSDTDRVYVREYVHKDGVYALAHPL
jgi:hypothetical protein